MGSTVPLGTVSLVIPFPQKGNGILFLCGFIFAIIIIIIIPFPQKGNGILFLCGFIFAIIIIIIIFDVVVVVVVKIPSFFKISQWNLVGTWVMGLIAYIMMYDRICHAVMELWQKM